MSVKAAVRHSGNVAIVDLSGRITLGEGAGLLRGTIKDLVTAGQNKILLNLKDVSYIDSAGLGEMVGSYASVTHQGGDIKLLNVPSKVVDLLQITKLFTVFATYTDEDEAVRELRGRGGGIARRSQRLAGAMRAWRPVHPRWMRLRPEIKDRHQYNPQRVEEVPEDGANVDGGAFGRAKPQP